MAKVNKPIPDFPEYAVDINGNVYGKRFGMPLKSDLDIGGYEYVILYKYKKPVHKLVHRLVLEAFVGKCPGGKETCHNNGIKTDNRLSNLRWDTKQSNAKDSVKHGTKPMGENHLRAKLLESDVRMIIYMWRTGEFTQQEIASIYNISQTRVGHIVNKKAWKHIWLK